MKELFHNLKFAWKYMRGQKLNLVLFVLSNILQICISVVAPVVSANIIVKLSNNLLIQVLDLSLVLLFIELIRNVIVYFNNYFSHKIYRESFTAVQSDLGSDILRLENKCIDANSSGVFMQRLISDTDSIADIFNVLNVYLTNILTDIGIFGVIFVLNKKVFLLLIFMILVIYIIESRRTSFRNERDKEYRKMNERVSSFVSEIVRGIRDIKMLGVEDNFIDELHNKVVDLNTYRYKMLSVNRNYNIIGQGFKDLFDTMMVFLLVFLIYNGEISIASGLVIHNYMGRVTSIVNYFGMLMEKVKSFNLSSSRILSIRDSPEFPKERFGNMHIDNIKGEFEFSNVNFSYDNEKKLLKDLSFKVNAHSTVAFVGASGAGKSTIFSLLCKMYDINSGKILIDGVDINELDRESIRNNISIISQNPYIFNASIRDNLRYVKKDLTDEEMKKACRIACLNNFIDSLDDGYDTIIGEGGVNLSGGQRQRLAIARALVQNTKIILFDEATSALDNQTQKEIQNAIYNMKNDYTIMIIAHRLSTVINSDRILFLNDGKIEASGTHEELMKKSIAYKKLYDAEMRKDNEEG